MDRALNMRLQNINNWIEENPNTDPNCYEMMDMAISVIDESKNRGGYTKIKRPTKNYV